MVDNDGVTCSSTPSSACANGVCFWCGFNDDKVVAFDVSDEVFQTTPLPDAISLAGNRFEYGRTFTVLNELVAMIVFPKNEEEKTCFDIWVLFEFGVKESWTRLVRIGSFLGLERPLGF
nr:F-box protein At3g07870-like [Quercus suber]